MRRLIALGVLKPGAAVPSMRDLARDLRVNPNTVARAYQRLPEAGVLAERRGGGTYLAGQPAPPRKSEKHGMSREAANRYISGAVAAGPELEEPCEAEEA